MSLAPDADSRAQSSAELARGLGRKVVASVILACVLYAALALYSDAKSLAASARTFAWDAFALGLALAAGNYGLRIVRWQYYLKRIDVHVPWGESSLVFLAGFVMSVTPGKVGEVFKSLLLYEGRGVSVARSAPIVIAERLTDLVALVLLVALGALSFEHGWAIAASAGVIVAALWLVCAYKPLGHFLLDLAARVPMLSRIEHRLREAYDALWALTQPGPLFFGSLVAFVAWALECGSLHVIVHGFEGAQLSAAASTFAYAASTLVGALAMMPGGLGVTEVGMAKLIETLGSGSISMGVATATTILVRIATLWFAVVIGLVALAAYRQVYGRRPSQR